MKAAQKEAHVRVQRGYNALDFAEAVTAWGARCAYCGQAKLLKASRHHLPPLPVCEKCQDAAVQCKATPLIRARVARWLNECHPGVPLPSPYPPRGSS